LDFFEERFVDFFADFFVDFFADFFALFFVDRFAAFLRVAFFRDVVLRADLLVLFLLVAM
jgi:hypothetical protein